MRTLVYKLFTFVQLLAVIRSELEIIGAPGTAVNGPLVWEPIPPSGYYVIGQYVSRYAGARYFNEKIDNPDLRIPVARARDESDELAEPLGFEKKIDYNNQLQFWSMICPHNYVSLSGIATSKLINGSDKRPDINRYRCVHRRITKTVHVSFSFHGNGRYGIWAQPVDGNSIGSYYVLAELRNDTSSIVGHQLALTLGNYTTYATALEETSSAVSQGATTTRTQVADPTYASTERESINKGTGGTLFNATTDDETAQTELKISTNLTLTDTAEAAPNAVKATQGFDTTNETTIAVHTVTTTIAKTKSSFGVEQSTKMTIDESSTVEPTIKIHVIISVACGIVLAILLVLIFVVICRKLGFCTTKKSKSVAMGPLGSSLSTEVAEFVYQETTPPSDGIPETKSQQRKREMRFNVLYEQTTPGELPNHSPRESANLNNAKSSLYTIS